MIIPNNVYERLVYAYRDLDTSKCVICSEYQRFEDGNQ